ncbi:MAG TPA: AAA family ATPase, partial [Candidatus Competibacteraceae bacterium]|nr:AAA family ATPase [Candidatus Competibacteraceae bacterium]
MRLSRIKLAGFKSFVDPTAFHLPSNLVGVVGPNGCGKSNIIDAVRWVMGESSARQLRGEAMADVIFNGSSSRKPVGQASVELIFDNSLGRLGGQWAQYAEISVKRLVSRDGQSSYFLNGVRCRRRDITDLFLGTGLGPRSYAIIEQGMISRLVEAKPEELRLFLEEAAGISKYKERRRETENRIQHTRENLARLGDLRQELEQQLERLGRQARAAEQYQRLRAEERRCKAELLAVRWRALDQALEGAEAELARLETARAALAAEHAALELRLEQGRERHEMLQEAFVAAQTRGYELAAEIARLEQNRAHGEELRRRQGEELQRLHSAVAQNRAQQASDGVELAALRQQAAAAEPQLVTLAARDAELAERLARAEAEMEAHQRRRALYTEALSAAQRQAEVERARIVQLERQQLQDERRLERLRLELGALDQDALELALETLREQEWRAEETLATGARRQAELEQRLAGLRQRQRELQAEQQTLRGRCEEARGRLAGLRTLQETALGRRQNDAVNAWLRARGLDGAPRLAERLAVEPGWEAAVEIVLGERLEAVPV